MTILRLRNYMADVEVLGTVLRAEYDEEHGGRLTLLGCDIGFAGRILERLAVGSIKGVEQNTAPPADGLAEVVKPARVDPFPTIPPGVLRAVPSEGVEAPPHVDDNVAGKVNAPTVAEQSTLGEAFQKADAPAAHAEQAKRIPPELATARRLRDVLVYFETQGVKGTEALVESCLAVKDSVPLLMRIANLPERVRRTCEIMATETGGE